MHCFPTCQNWDFASLDGVESHIRLDVEEDHEKLQRKVQTTELDSRIFIFWIRRFPTETNLLAICLTIWYYQRNNKVTNIDISDL
jgi:hypothetical protein